MKITLLPSALGPADAASLQYLTTYFLNDTIALDAGSLGFFATPERQRKVQHVLLSHTHLDHLASLPVFLENVYDADSPECVTVYGSPQVLDCLCRDFFNNRVWPDFIALSRRHSPFLKLEELESGKPLLLDGLRVTPVQVDHSVPAYGFVVEDDHSAVVLSIDTGPTLALWETASRARNLRAAFVEVSFPHRLARLAATSGHLTTAHLAAEMGKLPGPVRWIAMHLKPSLHVEIAAELQELALPALEIVVPGREYSF